MNIFSDYEPDPTLEGQKIQILATSEHISKLSEGLEVLSNELQSQVKQEHRALLSQASHAGRLVAALGKVNGHVNQLRTISEKLRGLAESQYCTVNSQTKVIARLHDVSYLLYMSGLLVLVSKKLKQESDSVVQSRLMHELEFVILDETVAKLDFVSRERASIVLLHQKLLNFAQQDIVNGLKDQNVTLVSRCLQIFSNLQAIAKCTENLISTYLNDIEQSLKDCFAGIDVSVLSGPRQSNSKSELPNATNLKCPGKASTLPASQNFSTQLSISLQWLIQDELVDYCCRVDLLQDCLFSIETEFNFTFDVSHVKTQFWSAVQYLFQSSFSESLPHVKQVLRENLPDLLSAAKGLEAKLSSRNYVFKRFVFQSLEAGYLAKCAANLKTALKSTEVIPSIQMVDDFMRVSSNEISAAIVDDQLALLVANVFHACCKEFWTKIEEQIQFGPEANQVVDVPNYVQKHNVSMANIIFYHSQAVKRMVLNRGDNFFRSKAAITIIECLKEGKAITMKTLRHLTDSMEATAGIILISMHREPGLNTQKPTNNPSLYMKELHDFLMRCWNLHIQRFDDREVVEICRQHLAERCVELFVNNITILRPISQPGRTRLKDDCLHLEAALKSVVESFGDLGRFLRILRASSTLIGKTPEELVAIEDESVLSSYHILSILFGYAGPDLESPHTSLNWSKERLLQWLDEHPKENERLELIAGATQKYRSVSRQKNITAYDPVFPLIIQYFDKVVRMKDSFQH